MALDTNLVSYYKFDASTSADSIGSNNGTDTAITYSSGNAKLGANGAGFNGTTSLINLGSGASLDDLTEFSYAFWIKPTNFTNEMMVLGKNNRWLRTFNGAKSGLLNCYLVYGTTPATSNTSNQALTSGAWNFVVITYSETGDRKIHAYVNATESTYSTQTASVGTITTDATNNLYLSTYEGTYQPYNGALDEVGVWNRALTGAEITSLYNGGAGLAYPFSGGGSPTYRRLSLLGVGN